MQGYQFSTPLTADDFAALVPSRSRNGGTPLLVPHQIASNDLSPGVKRSGGL